MANPFRNITFLSMEQATVLPYLSWRFAQEGARVIRFEHPKFSDPNRKIGKPYREGESSMCSYFMAFNSGKEAITLDLAQPKAKEILKDLLVKLNVDIDAKIRAGEGLMALKEDSGWNDVYGEQWEPLEGPLKDLILPRM